MAAILKVEGLRKAFGELKVLESVDFEVEVTGVHSLIGPNGAGKSTLFNCISGFHSLDHGKVTFRDRDVTELAPVDLVRRGLARTFQISSVFPRLTMEENVSLALVKAKLRGRMGLLNPRGYRQGQRDELSRLMEMVGLGSHNWSTLAGSLSHGDVRSLEVAMALACHPHLLCLDEPTAGMGVGESDYFGSMIAKLSETIPVLLVEHRIEMVLAISDRITVLAGGSVICDGTPSDISSSQAVRDAYLGVATQSSGVSV